MSLGLARAGWQVTGVENNPEAVQTQRQNGLDCIQADIRYYRPTGKVALVAGGVPCQPHSLARVKGVKGTYSDKGGLHLHLLRIAAEAGADTILIENVKGMYTSPSARGFADTFEEVYSDITEAGFTHRVLRASWYGVPQRRDRLFIIASRVPGFADRFFWSEPKRTVETTVAEALGSTGLLSEAQIDGLRAIGLWDTRACTTISTKNRITAPGWRTEKSTQFKGSVAVCPEVSAILQGFTRGYTFYGQTTAQRVQIGNAVPPALAEAVGKSILSALST